MEHWGRYVVGAALLCFAVVLAPALAIGLFGVAGFSALVLFGLLFTTALMVAFGVIAWKWVRR